MPLAALKKNTKNTQRMIKKMVRHPAKKLSAA